MTIDFDSLSEAVLTESAYTAGKVLERSVIPLSVYNANRRPEHVATSILLRIDEHHFLVTAGHAVVQTRDQHLFAGFPGIKLQRVPARMRQASRVNILEVDDLDIGLMPLPASEIGHFARGTFLDLDAIDLNQFPDPTREGAVDYFVYGYSAARSQVKVNHIAKVLQQTSFHLRTSAAPMSAYPNQKLDPRRHLLLNHDPKDVLIGGRLSTMPQMKGVSGGAVFHCPPDRKPTLVAIVIEYRKRGRVIVATRMASVLAFARFIIANKAPATFA